MNLRFSLLLAGFLIGLIISIARHESQYKVGTCVKFGDQVLTIVEETETSYILANKYIRIMDKKAIIRRYFGVTECKK